jgi:hypothetical protein
VSHDLQVSVEPRGARIEREVDLEFAIGRLVFVIVGILLGAFPS